jgi:MarR family transcriptional regulator, organic hydroperoxide resistance regulator
MKHYSKPEKLDGIVDNMLMLVPAFYRNLMSGANAKSRSNPVNTELRILFILNEIGIMQSSELGRKLGITKSNVTPLVDKLIEKGYTIRMPDERDRRVINISLTAKGKRFVASKRRIFANQIKVNLATLSGDELNALYSSVETFRDIISRIGESHPKQTNAHGI